MTILGSGWQRHFQKDRGVSVNESMIAYKGRTGLLQYMPNKPHKRGIKSWGLADSRTGYMLNYLSRMLDPMLQTASGRKKPKAVQLHSQHMGGVDLADKQLQYYMVLHRCCKWWKKVFLYFMELSFNNALVIYKAAHPGKRVNSEKFTLVVATKFLEGYDRLEGVHELDHNSKLRITIYSGDP
ncbi:uncharacterized protein LOC125383620 [Haliotis rufescens]|uniref:uncharacterized protein LOC125383620 n=1 Tax=Haliotis rufescens TaxID=6454 RepID=UPI00201F128F|nr:uncharacterized protein LOC125383620 [Haliotis rufescens]